MMKINHLSLTNFRRFASLSVDLHDQLTVVVARNGQGKTSILDAGAIALGTFVGAFDHGRAKHIERDDARLMIRSDSPDSVQQFPVEVEATFEGDDGELFSIKRQLTGPKSKTTIKDAAALTVIGRHLQKEIRRTENPTEIDLPVIAYYGTGRLWKAHKNMERKSVLSESRTMGYEDCLSSASSFTQLQQWMAKAELARLQDAEAPRENNRSNISARIRAIQNAVNQVIKAEGWTGFRYSVTHEELAMSHPEAGELPVSMLSDGVRAMVSLVADLAWRCARLNGHMGESAPSNSRGIVFIDEVDIHLHPSWQQRVVALLLETFPRLQFIMTTHSPQVLTTVAAENIRVLEVDAGIASAISPIFSPLAHESGVALAKVMGTHREPDLPVQKLVNEFEQMVRAGDEDSEAARALREQIQHEGYQFHESDLTTWRFLAARANQVRR